MKKLIVGIGVVLAVAIALLVIKQQVNHRARMEIDHILAENTQPGAVSYANVNVNLLTHSVTISDIEVATATNDRVLIDTVHLHQFDREAAIPPEFHMQISGIQTQTTASTLNTDWLQALGYSDVKSDMEIHYLYNQEQKIINLETLAVSIENAGTLDFSAQLSNFTYDPQLPPLLMVMAMQAVNIDTFTITYVDQTLAEKLMDMAAANVNETPDNFRRVFDERIQASIDAEQNPATKQTLAKVQAFLKDPKRITLTAHPEQPVPIGQLVDAVSPEFAISQLKLEIDL